MTCEDVEQEGDAEDGDEPGGGQRALNLSLGRKALGVGVREADEGNGDVRAYVEGVGAVSYTHLRAHETSAHL
eukprot:240320-Alexandrium_andersonii.AAC.1